MDPRVPANSLIHEYPNCLVGYVYLADAERTLGNYMEYYDNIELAQQMLQTHPDLNKHLTYLLPNEKEIENKLESVWAEQLENKVWTLTTPCSVKNELKFEITSTIYRLQDNSLIIINPGQFSTEQRDKINSLGKVQALITTTSGHGIGITHCHKLWENAQLYGTQSGNKHDHPELPWTGFIDDKTQLFAPDLQNITFPGNFCDTVLYDAKNKILIGPTDIIASTTPKKSWSSRLYHFSTGMWRGPKRTTEISLQHYHNFIQPNLDEFRRTLEKVYALDFQTLILGHHGIYRGNEGKQRLTECYTWLFRKESNENKDFAYTLSTTDNFFLRISYFHHSYLSTMLWLIIKSNVLNFSLKKKDSY